MTKLCVLIVEDEPIIAMLLSEVLEELGHSVCAVAATEADAIDAAAKFKPGLMIVDARLRQGSGIAAVRSILVGGFIPHIFVSGDRLSADTLAPGAVVLQKPFQEPELVLAIMRALAAEEGLADPASREGKASCDKG